MKFLSRFYIAIIFLILYAPILVVILFSFNASGSLSDFSGFSLYNIVFNHFHEAICFFPLLLYALEFLHK